MPAKIAGGLICLQRKKSPNANCVQTLSSTRTKKDAKPIVEQSNIKTNAEPKTNWVQRHAGAGDRT